MFIREKGKENRANDSNSVDRYGQKLRLSRCVAKLQDDRRRAKGEAIYADLKGSVTTFEGVYG